MRLLLALSLFAVLFGCAAAPIRENGSIPAPQAPPPPPSKTCHDSDGGMNPDVKGALSLGNESYQDSCDGDLVKEYYCQGNELKLESASCPSGSLCIEGACAPRPKNETAPQTKCLDSDGGNSIFANGSVDFEGHIYMDACQGVNDLLEYYCEGDVLKQNTSNCGAGNKCQNGACVGSEKTCIETDSPDQSKTGTATQYGGGIVVQSKSDSCIDDRTLNETYCSLGMVLGKLVACDAGSYCSGGSCVASCSDGDGGLNGSVASYAKDRYSTVADFCPDEDTLLEAVCDGNSTSSEEMPCESGCFKGRCLAKADLKCKDSGLEVKLMVGNDVFQWKNDTCADYATAIDYKCISDKIEPIYKSCSDDQVCNGTRCQDITASACYDLDSEEPDDGIHMKSQTVETTNDSIDQVKDDYCLNDVIVTEYFCHNTGISADFITCPTDEKCSDGACFYPYTCSDSDGGKSLLPGVATLYEDGNIVRSQRDACADNDTIHEQFCDENGKLLFDLLNCPEGQKCDPENGSCK